MERSRHTAPRGVPWWRWDRADAAILMCGVLAFLAITFGGPLFQYGSSLTLGEGVPDGTAATPPAPLPAAVVPSPTPAAAPSPTAAQSTTPAPASASASPPGPVLPAAAAPLRVRYPAAGFDVPVHPLKPDSRTRTIEPPPTRDGYWLSPYGSPGAGSTNTTYVIGHSWDGADAPFNHLSSQAAKGDRFAVDTRSGTITYRVETVTTYLKSTLADSSIWDVVPNRLVLISCYTQDLWGKNVVVIASPAPA
ncbi:class F sortase [Pseudarthrobacter sp. NPDC092424]|uniref:class F sortase n=1 Tax=Pseudarthrobacter sp. NPDC092424 TaxID=3364415 RepID=UPI0037F2C3F5